MINISMDCCAAMILQWFSTNLVTYSGRAIVKYYRSRSNDEGSMEAVQMQGMVTDFLFAGSPFAYICWLWTFYRGNAELDRGDFLFRDFRAYNLTRGLQFGIVQ